MRYPLSVLSFVVAASSSIAHANTVAYSSASGFASATTAATAYAIPAPGSNAGFAAVPSPYTVGTLTFSGASLSLFNDAYYGMGQSYLGLDGSKTYTVTAGGVSAVALDLGSFLYIQTLAIQVNGIPLEKLAFPEAQESVFLGITSTTPIETISLIPSVAKSEVDVLNAEVATTVATTPEPSSSLLLATGLLALLGIKQRSLPIGSQEVK